MDAFRGRISTKFNVLITPNPQAAATAAAAMIQTVPITVCLTKIPDGSNVPRQVIHTFSFSANPLQLSHLPTTCRLAAFSHLYSLRCNPFAVKKWELMLSVFSHEAARLAARKGKRLDRLLADICFHMQEDVEAPVIKNHGLFEQNECGICYEELELGKSEMTTMMPCSPVFHYRCLTLVVASESHLPFL